MLQNILENIRFLACQAFPFCSSEREDNFTQLLKLHGNDDDREVSWMMEKRMKSFMSPKSMINSSNYVMAL